MLIITMVIVGIVLLFIFILASLYTVVPADYVDVVIQGKKISVVSSHRAYSTSGKSAYFRIPSWLFLFNLGMVVHRIPLQIIKLDVPNFLAFDNQRARFVVDIVAYVTVKDPIKAAQRFSGDLNALNQAISVIVQATTRDITTKRPIREIINNRDDIIRSITPPMKEAIDHWGLDLNDIELIDFKDPDEKSSGIKSHVIEDISQIIEQQINSEMRQKNADQLKAARLKEAEADEEASKREIMRNEVIQRRDQERMKEVAKIEKEATEQALEVTKVQQVKTQEIEKARKLVEAQQLKEVEEINKQQKKLVGEGDRLMKEEQAKGEAAPILEKGLAEAKAKEALQAALNKFKDEAIRALVAEKIVEKDKAIGIAGAEALKAAEIKAFLGGGIEGEKAFDVGKALEALTVSNAGASASVMHRIGIPNDLGGGVPIQVESKKSKAGKPA